MVKTKNRMPVLRVPAQAAIWYLAASVIGRGIGLFSALLFTRVLPTAEFGIYPLYNSFFAVISIFATLEIAGGVTFSGLQRFKGQENRFLSAALGLLTLTVAIICVALFLFRGILVRISGLTAAYFAVMLTEIFSNAVIGLYLAFCRYKYSYRSVFAISTTISALTPILSFFFVYALNLGGEGRIFGAATVAVLFALPLCYLILKRGDTLFNREVWYYILRINIPLLPHYFAAAFILRIGEISIARYYGTGALAKYSIAISLGFALTVLTGALSSAIGPWITRKIATGSINSVRTVLGTSGTLISIISIILSAALPDILKFLTPMDYHSVLPAIYPFVFCAAPSLLSTALTQGQLYFGRSTLTGLPTVVSSIITAVLSITLLPRLDFRFTSLFVLAAYICTFILNSIVFKIISGSHGVRIMRFLLVYSISTAYSLIMLLLKDYTLIRALLTVPVIPFLFKLLKQTVTLVRE